MRQKGKGSGKAAIRAGLQLVCPRAVFVHSWEGRLEAMATSLLPHKSGK